MSKKEEFKIVNPSFPCLIYEMEQLLKDGWKVSQGVYMEPIYIAGLYEINLERDVREANTVVESSVEVTPKTQGRPKKVS